MNTRNQKKLMQLLPHNYAATVQALYKETYSKNISKSAVYRVAKGSRNNVLIMNILSLLAAEHKTLNERVNKRVLKLLKPQSNAKR